MGIFSVYAVVNGAVLRCSKGNMVSAMRGATGLVSVGGAVAAVVTDNTPANVGTFGLCLTTCGPCAPVCVAPWVGSGASVFSGRPLLSSAATLACARQGSISIVDPGQQTLTIGQATEDEKLAELLLESLTPEQVRAAIAARLRELHAHGQFPKNTAIYDTLIAIGTVMAHKDLINRLARRYGIPPALLAGVVASEMEFDLDVPDQILDGLNRNLGVQLWTGPGIASVHTRTLRDAVNYIGEHQLPGHSNALLRVWPEAPFHNKGADLPVSIEAAAIATSMYNHAHGGSRTPEDMAVVWGGYRSGVRDVGPSGHGYTLEGFRRNEANGADDLPPEMRVGKNAYMSEPMFAYFQQHFH